MTASATAATRATAAKALDLLPSDVTDRVGDVIGRLPTEVGERMSDLLERLPSDLGDRMSDLLDRLPSDLGDRMGDVLDRTTRRVERRRSRDRATGRRPVVLAGLGIAGLWVATGAGTLADARRYPDIVWDDAGEQRRVLPLLAAAGPFGAAWYWTALRPRLAAAAVAEKDRGG